jgi:hypothetical protein
MSFTARLKKGGALLTDMRMPVLAASKEPQIAISAETAYKALTKETAARRELL